MFDGIVDFVLFKIIPSIAVLMLVVGGAMFIISYFGGAEAMAGGGKGGPALLGRAKKLINSVMIGLAIIFAAWLIINTLLMFLGVADWTGLREGWFSIPCQVKI
ncbi:MAG: hypothetical protein ABH831_02145, partial [Candidatus Nealsonbacteria bacterium]